MQFLPLTAGTAVDLATDSLSTRFSDQMLDEMARAYMSRSADTLRKVRKPGRVPRYPRQIGLGASQGTRERQ